jgi:hypothetical protein
VRRLKVSRLLRTIDKAVRSDRRVPNPLLSTPAEATAPNVARPTIGAFTLMDNPAGRWHEADLGQTVVYGVDPAGDPSLGADATNAAMDAAFAAWSSVDGTTIRLARGGAIDLAPLICDGVSQIIFGDPFDEMPKPQSCSGVLALGGYCTKGRGASSPTSSMARSSAASRRATSPSTRASAGAPFWNATNLAEVATHEIGHTIGLGHSSESDDEPQPSLKDATMYYRAHFDGRGAGLRPDDVAAVRFIYPGTRARRDRRRRRRRHRRTPTTTARQRPAARARECRADRHRRRRHGRSLRRVPARRIDGRRVRLPGDPDSTLKVTESDVFWRGTVALPRTSTRRRCASC